MRLKSVIIFLKYSSDITINTDVLPSSNHTYNIVLYRPMRARHYLEYSLREDNLKNKISRKCGRSFIGGQGSFKSTSYKFINQQQTVVYVGQRTFVTSLYLIEKGYYSLRTSANYFDGKIPLRKSRSITFVWCWAKRAVWGILTRSTRLTNRREEVCH